MPQPSSGGCPTRIHRSRQSNVTVPDVGISAWVLREAGLRGGKPALVDGLTGEVLTFSELERRANAAAAGLWAAGVGPGEVVGVMSHNQPAFVTAFHAVLRAGAAWSPVNPLSTTGDVVKQLTEVGARTLIVAEECAAKGIAAARAIGIRLYVLGHRAGCPPFEELYAHSSSGASGPLHEVSDATAALPFSSGTTGEPKGVTHAHRHMVANLEQLRLAWHLDTEDVLSGVLPFSHIYGNVVLNLALLVGATTVTLPRFDLRSFLETVQQHGVTRGFLAPPVILQLAQAGEVSGYDLSSMRHVICGAAPLDGALAERTFSRTGCMVRQAYGSTEALAALTAQDDDFEESPPGSVGRLLPGTEARLVNPETGADVRPGEPGELWIRGPQVATTGWLRTGDLARVDGEYFTIVDRLKDLIKYKGYQVAPAELEALLLSHPDVVDACVVGVPDPLAGEAPRAFVVGDGIDPESLMEWVADRVAPYKKVRSVQLVNEIPRSPAGKILRKLLQGRILPED